MPHAIAAQVWLEFNFACQSVRSKSDLADLVVRTVGRLGYDHVNISLIRDYDLPKSELQFGLASTYPDDWVEYYMEKGCMKFDPVALAAYGNASPFYWEELNQYGLLAPLQAGLMNLAADAGLYNGVGLPFPGPRSLRGGIALATSSPNAECLRDLNVLWSISSLFYRRLKELVGLQQPRVFRLHNLTDRELAILIFTGAGKTDRYMADSLGVTDHTVNQHFRKIYRKLDAHTRAQAFAVAVKRGIIDIP